VTPIAFLAEWSSFLDRAPAQSRIAGIADEPERQVRGRENHIAASLDQSTAVSERDHVQSSTYPQSMSGLGRACRSDRSKRIVGNETRCLRLRWRAGIVKPVIGLNSLRHGRAQAGHSGRDKLLGISRPSSRLMTADGDCDSGMVLGDGQVCMMQASNSCRKRKAQSRPRQCAAAF
jgi:hypothetical protein